MIESEFERLQNIYTQVLEIEELSNITNNKLLFVGKSDLTKIEKHHENYFLTQNLGLRFYLKFSMVILYSFIREILKLSFFKIIEKEKNEAIAAFEVLALTHLIANEGHPTHTTLLNDLLDNLKLRCKLGVVSYPQMNRFQRRRVLIGDHEKLVLKSPIGFWQSMGIIFSNCGLAIKILRFSRIKKLNLDVRRFLARCSIHQLSTSAFQDLFVAREMSKKIHTMAPHTFLLPYEGHTLELTIISHLQQVFPGLRICAYQHAPISKSQLGFFRGIALFSSNTFLLTTGEIVKEIVQGKRLIRKEGIRVLGSAKNYSLALKEVFEKDITGRFILLPESSSDSIDSCLNFLEESKGFIDISKCKIRLHPRTSIFDRQELEKKFLHPNFISNESMDFDFHRSDFCVYQSSSTVFEAMQYGVIPVFASRYPRSLLDPLVLILEIPKYSRIIRGLLDLSPKTFEQIFDLNKTRRDVLELSSKYFESFNKSTLSWISISY